MSSQKSAGAEHATQRGTSDETGATEQSAGTEPRKRSFQEKRDFIRMQIESPVEVLVAGDPSPLSGMCRDLSGGGMLIEIATVLSPGTEVEVTLESSHGHAPMLRATAVVTRTGRVKGANMHEVGLRLKDILL